MQWREAASAAALGLLALFALVYSTRLDIGGPTRPGPGFFPLIVSAALLLVAVALVVAAARHRAPTRVAPPAAPPRAWALVLAVLALAVYIALFERLGFVLSTAALLAFFFGVLARYRWPLAVGAAVAVAFTTRLVFDRWLQVRLPPDFWGR